MIDTDKYEGHTEGPWKWSYSDDVAAQLLIIPNGNDGIGNGVCIGLGDADAQLIADAPLLLEEVKRLRDAMEQAIGYVVGDYYVLKVLCKALGKQLNPTRGEEE